MKCPRCPDSVLEEREREGVTVDGCRTCYGIWLDRGELERLVSRARDEIEQLERRDRPARPPEPWHEPLYAPRPAPSAAFSTVRARNGSIFCVPRMPKRSRKS